MFRILFFGDIVGAIGRRGVIAALPALQAEYQPDLILANVENLAHGRGITPKTLHELDAAGIDAYTSGNHVWENPAGIACFSDPAWCERLVRPANVNPSRAGRGSTILERQGKRILLINVMGQLFMKDTESSPFLACDRLIEEAGPVDIVIADHHAETTSEKEALGHYLDGRATLVIGTHTHVPTADAKLLPGGTAYITDIGRNGGRDTVVGFEKTSATQRFLNPGGRSYDPPEHGQTDINCILATIDLDTKRAIDITHIHKIVDE